MRYALLICLLAPSTRPAPSGQDRDDYKAARGALKRGDYAESEKLLKRLAFENRDHWTYRTLLLAVCRATGRAADAEKLCREFLASHADHPGAKAALSLALLEQDDPAKALEAATGDDVRVRVARALALAALGRDDDALALTGKFAEEYKQKKDIYMREEAEWLARGVELHARLASDNEAYRLALRTILPDLIHSDPADAELKAWQARLNIDKGNTDDSTTLLDQALQANPKCAAALVQQGRVAYAQGNLPQAIALADQALAQNPASVDAHLLKTRAVDPAKAAAALEKGLQQRPKSVRLLAAKAALCALAGDDAGAAEARKAALANNPASPYPDLECGRALLTSGQIRFADAHACFKRAIEAAPKLLEAQLHYALSLFRLGDEKTAREALELVNKKDPFDKRADDCVTLLNDLNRDYDTVKEGAITVRLPRTHAPWLAQTAARIAATTSVALAKEYGPLPSPLRIDLFDESKDVVTRAGGAPCSGNGVCLGTDIAVLCPPAKLAGDGYLFAAELAGQVARAHAAALSKGRAPRWLLDGVALRAAQPWDRDADFHALNLKEPKVVGGTPRAVALYLDFLGVEKTGAFIASFAAKPGEIDEKGFSSWLGKRTAGMKYVLPPKEPAAKLASDADADPAKAVLAARAFLPKDPDKAIKYARLALKKDENNAEAKALLGQALVKKRRAEEAHPHLMEATKAGIDDYRTWMALGIAELELEEQKKAAAAFEKAAGCLRLVADPEGDNALRRLVEIAVRQKDTDTEEKLLARIVAADPYAWRDRLKLAKRLIAQKAWDDAVTLMEAGVVIQPRDREGWALLGQSLEGAGKLEEALPSRKASSALAADGEEKADALVALGRLQLKLGKKDEARKSAKEAMKEWPGHEGGQKLYDECLK